MSIRVRITLSWVAAMLLAAPMFAQPLQATPKLIQFHMDLSAARFGAIDNGRLSQRGGAMVTAGTAIRASNRVGMRLDGFIASPRGRDIIAGLVEIFAFDTSSTIEPPGTFTDSGARRRSSETTLIGLSPTIEFMPTKSPRLRVRLGMAYLQAEGPSATPYVVSGVRIDEVTAAGFGWRAGVSAALGPATSPISVSADVMRAGTPQGTLLLVPLGLTIRLR
jgi:hypothetical protein